jgi:hypothetical protein
MPTQLSAGIAVGIGSAEHEQHVNSVALEAL